MLTCHCCSRRSERPCSCLFSTCRTCLYCLTHCACTARSGRVDPAKMAALDPEDGLDELNGPFADLHELKRIDSDYFLDGE